MRDFDSSMAEKRKVVLRPDDDTTSGERVSTVTPKQADFRIYLEHTERAIANTVITENPRVIQGATSLVMSF